MDLIKFENLWKFMKDYNLELVDVAPSGILCCICNGIMIEPYLGKCGCRFCERCINNYLSGDVKHCPGERELCSSIFLEISINVIKDNNACNKIGDLEVKCPNESCLFRTKLINIEEHVRLCMQKLVSCPFKAIGCANKEITGENINEHMKLDSYIHSRLLIETIHYLRSDVEYLKVKKDKQERKLLKTKGDMIKLKGLVSELRCQKDKDKMDIENYKKEIIILKEEGINMRQEIENYIINTNKLKEDIENNLKGFEDIREDNQRKELHIMEISNEIKDIKETIKNQSIVKEEYETYRMDGEFLACKLLANEVESNRLKEYSEELKLTMERIMTVVLKSVYSFVWTFNEVSQKFGWYDSVPFYKDNYKFRLRLMIGKCYLRSHICIMKGEHDDRLEWPMKQTIKISILNPKNFEEYTCGSYSFETYDGELSAFDRTSDTMGSDVIGPYMALQDGALKRSLSHDSVIVCCVLLVS